MTSKLTRSRPTTRRSRRATAGITASRVVPSNSATVTNRNPSRRSSGTACASAFTVWERSPRALCSRITFPCTVRAR